MKSKYKYFIYPFLISFGVFVVINTINYLLSNEVPKTDGIAQIGFPITFLSYGGQLNHFYFSLLALSADIAIALIVALAISFIYYKKLLQREFSAFK